MLDSHKLLTLKKHIENTRGVQRDPISRWGWWKSQIVAWVGRVGNVVLLQVLKLNSLPGPCYNFCTSHQLQ